MARFAEVKIEIPDEVSGVDSFDVIEEQLKTHGVEYVVQSLGEQTWTKVREIEVDSIVVYEGV